MVVSWLLAATQFVRLVLDIREAADRHSMLPPPTINYLTALLQSRRQEKLAIDVSLSLPLFKVKDNI